MNEDYYDNQIDELYENLEERVWVDSNGDEIHVSDLTDNHLNAIISMLERTDNHPLSKEWLKVLNTERTDRIASDFD